MSRGQPRRPARRRTLALVAALPALYFAGDAGIAAPSRARSASAIAASVSASSATLADTLSFEFTDTSGAPSGWHEWMPPVRWDGAEAHGGRASARIERDSTSANDFSAFSRVIPADARGDTLELRGWIRTRGVTGFAGIWLREDGRGSTLQFDNMENRQIAGTTPWTQYRIRLPLDQQARTLVFGGLLVGMGTVWVDDMELLVDGVPASRSPRAARVPPGAERDHEFDAGSRLSRTELLAAPVENLVLAAKVWGFLKYHHARIAEGAQNWDYELFRFLPEAARTRNRAEAARSLAHWIDRVGMPPACRPCAASAESVAMEAPIRWIHDRNLLGVALVSRLERVHRDRATAPEQYYVAASGLNATFLHENDYKTPDYPDAGYRLLALFRFWNVIEYWYPYRDLLPDWDAVLAEFIPRLLACRDRDEYRLAMIDLVARVHDSHANVWDALEARPPRGGCRLPVAVRSVGDRFVVGAYADSARAAASGFRVGDVILALDGASVDSLARAWSPHHGASNEAARRRNIAESLTRGPCGPCSVRVDRPDGYRDLAAVRDSSRLMNARAGATHDLPGPAFRKLADDLAYLKLSTVVAADVGSYLEHAAGTRFLVIDIRNYPSQFVVFALGQHLVDRPTPFARFTHGDPSNPGTFVWTSPIVLEPALPHYSGRVVILVDEMSQSQAEYTAMAFRSAPGALVVGSTTAGADGNVSPVPLPGGLHPVITGLGVYYPDGRPTQQIGIVPDLVVHPTIEGIRAGRDEVLEAALEAALGRQVRVPNAP